MLPFLSDGPRVKAGCLGASKNFASFASFVPAMSFVSRSLSENLGQESDSSLNESLKTAEPWTVNGPGNMTHGHAQMMVTFDRSPASPHVIGDIRSELSYSNLPQVGLILSFGTQSQAGEAGHSMPLCTLNPHLPPLFLSLPLSLNVSPSSSSLLLSLSLSLSLAGPRSVFSLSIPHVSTSLIRQTQRTLPY